MRIIDVTVITVWLALMGPFVMPGLAEEMHCPATISVKQSLVKKEQGWKESTSDIPILLAGVTFFDGPPEQKASLVYDSETRSKGKQIAIWRFGSNSQIWISCRYSGSNIVLSRPLTKSTSTCKVTYNPRQTIDGLPEIERIECQ